MTVSRGRRAGRQTRTQKRNPERSQHGGRASNGQRRFIRKLIYVLADIIDAKEDFEHEDDDAGGYDEPTGEIELTETVKDSHPNLQHPEPNAFANIVRLKELCNTHRQLISQIQSSLKALGGGDRTAKALEDMHTGFAKIPQACILRQTDTKLILYPRRCSDALNEAHDAAEKVINSFHELGVFNITFFEATQKLVYQIKTIAIKLEVEYDTNKHYSFVHLGNASSYIDFLWGGLVSNFEAYLRQLTDIAEKEIATIRQTQDFSSQQYLNLTTVATFLSSVTATTLQITADDPASTLEILINTLWFLSLVFSTASAVYSLLVMTWRQSSVRQPDKSLPPWADSWLRNGPMYALIVALSTFSIGLCLLAFVVMDRQGRLVSAVVPTAFAGLHVYAIITVSAYFISEQRHGKCWGSIATIIQPVADKVKDYGSRVKDRSSLMKQRVRLIFTSLPTKTTKSPSPTRSVEKNKSDLELGQFTSANSPVPSQPNLEANLRSYPEQSNCVFERIENVEPENVFAIPQCSAPPPENDSELHGRNDERQSIMRRNLPLERLLEFSPDGRILARGFSNKLITYTCGELRIHRTYNLPMDDRALEVDWSSKNELLLRTTHKLFVWTDTQITGDHFDEPLVAPFEQKTAAARWFQTDISDVSLFVCASGNTVKSFDINCEEFRSFNLSDMLTDDKITIIDVAPVGITHILCLITRPSKSNRNNWLWDSPNDLDTVLIVINMDSGTIESDYSFGDHFFRANPKHLAVSQKTETVLAYDDNAGAQVFSILSSSPLQLRSKPSLYDWERSRAMFCFYRGTKVLIEASKGKARIFYQPSEQENFSTLHSFTMQNEKANASNPTCFAVNQSNSPYMFAFGDESGSVYIWSIQSDQSLRFSELVEVSNVEDRAEDRDKPIISSGRFMILPTPEDTRAEV